MSACDPVLASVGGTGAALLDVATLLEHLEHLFGRRRNAGMLVSVLQGFERQGLAHLAASWVSTGPNLSLTPAQLRQGLGDGLVRQFAQAAGLTDQATAQALAILVPYVIDGLTPAGVVPLASDRRPPLAARTPAALA